MARLKSRNAQIPNGLKYFEALTGWESVKQVGSHPSFDRLVDAVLNHRLGNPRYAGKWKTSRAGVEADVEAYNAKLCETKGWWDFIVTSDVPNAPPPKVKPPSSLAGVAAAASRKATAGIKLVVEWLGEGLKPEPIEVANQRAAICVQCPKNEDGGFFERIGALAARDVKALVEVRNDMKLSTEYDEQLKSCSVCSCWMPLKVFSPSELILKNTSDEVRSRLDPRCWILRLQ